MCVVSNYSERPALVTLLLMITKQGTAREFIGDRETGTLYIMHRIEVLDERWSWSKTGIAIYPSSTDV